MKYKNNDFFILSPETRAKIKRRMVASIGNNLQSLSVPLYGKFSKLKDNPAIIEAYRDVGISNILTAFGLSSGATN